MNSHTLVADVESSLLARIVSGDEAAMSELYERLAPTLKGLRLRITRDTAVAREILTDVFAELWERNTGGSETTAPAAPDAESTVSLARLEPGERKLVLAQAVATMSPLARRALELAYFHGRSAMSIAHRLNVPATNVPHILGEACAELGDRLRSYLPQRAG